MKFRIPSGVVVSGALALSLLTPVALAQRAIPQAGAGTSRSQQKLPAAPAPVQEPLTRDTSGPAQTPGEPKARVPESKRAARGIPLDRLYFDTQPDGSTLVRGRTYKAEFSPAGATYIPFCGSAAPQNHPLTFRIQGITSGGEPVAFADAVAAVRTGETVSYARGGVSELYALGVDSVEQKFVFESLPASGELVLRLACTSDMSASASDGAIVFRSADGSVRYGAATVVDADGASAPAQAQIVDQQIEIRVPAEFLANAAFPITIDPVITTFEVFWFSDAPDDFAPSIAWDVTNQRYCTVYEQVYSASDHDVPFVFSDFAGNFINAGYVDVSTTYWAAPDVANNHNASQFYAVAQAGDPSGGARTIRGRTIDAATGTVGTDIEISVGTSGEDVNPSVGGDPFGSTAAYYTVVWQRIYIVGSDTDILCQQVDQNGALLNGIIYIDNTGGTLDRNPSISKSCLAVGYHHVVWHREIAAGDADVYAAELLWDGTINIPSTAIVTGGNTPAPACSPIDNTGQWLLVYEYDFVSDHDIIASLMSGVTVNSTLYLTSREYQLGSGTLFEDQIHPAADTDGVHFACSYSESYLGSTTDYDIRVSSIDSIGSNLTVGDFHQILAFDTSHEDFPRMASHQTVGGSTNRIGVVWSDDTNGSANLGNIEAGVYAPSDFTKLCWANIDGVGGCPCANNPSAAGLGCNNSSGTGGASLNGSGNAALSNDSATFTTFGERPTAPSILAQGSALLAGGANFGQGVRCAGGSLKRMYVHSAVGGSITAPSGLDLPIHTRSAALADPLSPGSTRYYFVYYRDPFVLGGCPLSLGFNSTDTVQVVWRP